MQTFETKTNRHFGELPVESNFVTNLLRALIGTSEQSILHDLVIPEFYQSKVYQTVTVKFHGSGASKKGSDSLKSQSR